MNLSKIVSTLFHSASRGMMALIVATAACGLPDASAQPYPSGPIVIVVPFEPGGPTDLIPRLIAPKMSETFGVPVTVENKPGAAGNVGAGEVARSKPDGRKLLLFQGGLFTVNPWIFKEIPFNPQRDFTPITDLASTPNVMVVNSEVKANTIAELIEQIKQNPNAFNYGTPGRGTSPHLCVESFKLMGGGLNIVHIPFKSGPAAITNLLSNQVQLSCMNISAVLPSIKANRVRALAITTATRSNILPGLPTMEEVGFKGFEVSGWFGLAAPAQTPKETVSRLNAVIREALADPQVAARLNAAGLTILGDSPENVARIISAESSKWRKIIESANIRMDD